MDIQFTYAYLLSFTDDANDLIRQRRLWRPPRQRRVRCERLSFAVRDTLLRPEVRYVLRNA